MSSYSRKFKKLAGPSFNINVRFDDAHIRLSRSGGLLTSEQNRGFDKVHSSELFDVKEGELLLAKKQSHTRDGYARCFSSLNGFQGGGNLDELKEKVYNDCVFIGVALTDFKSDQAGYMDQGFVAQVAGIVTVPHEGQETLHPGDLVGWAVSEVPYNRVRKGIPPNKERLVLVKAPKQLETEMDEEDLLKNSQARNRIIGKAMSYARTGDTVDLLVLPRGVY